VVALDASRPCSLLAGLCQLRWRSVDVHHERLIVDQAKTDAGRRQVDLTLDVVDELNSWRAERGEVSLDAVCLRHGERQAP
jgi:integrase